MSALQERLRAAVQAEQDAEKESLRALYGGKGLDKLLSDGAVLVGLQGTRHSQLLSARVWRFGLGGGSAAGGTKAEGGGTAGGTKLPYHRFRRGDNVLLSQWRAGGCWQLVTRFHPVACVDDLQARNEWHIQLLTKGQCVFCCMLLCGSVWRGLHSQPIAGAIWVAAVM